MPGRRFKESSSAGAMLKNGFHAEKYSVNPIRETIEETMRRNANKIFPPFFIIRMPIKAKQSPLTEKLIIFMEVVKRSTLVIWLSERVAIMKSNERSKLVILGSKK
jgi:hypothetical protein